MQVVGMVDKALAAGVLWAASIAGVVAWFAPDDWSRVGSRIPGEAVGAALVLVWVAAGKLYRSALRDAESVESVLSGGDSGAA